MKGLSPEHSTQAGSISDVSRLDPRSCPQELSPGAVTYDPIERIFAAPDPDDNKFIECASAAHARLIITGDKKFLSLKRHGGIRVLSPEDFLQGRKMA